MHQTVCTGERVRSGKHFDKLLTTVYHTGMKVIHLCSGNCISCAAKSVNFFR